MTKKRIPFGTITITKSAKERINESLTSGRVSGGKYLNEFESKFAEYIGVKHAVAVSSGTDALTLALSILRPRDIPPVYRYILLPALTFIATANAVINSGFKPIFIDIDKYTLNMDLNILNNSKIYMQKSMGIIPVHLMGNPVDMDKLKEIINPYMITIIEDAAEAHGTTYKNKRVGSIGEMGCFSTYLAHIISTIDGGVVTTNNDIYAKDLRSLRMHGRNCTCKQCVINTFGSKCDNRFKDGTDQRFLFDRIGYSSRMNELEAAVGLGCLEEIDNIVHTRHINYIRIVDGLVQIPKFNELFYLMNTYIKSEFSPHAFPIICKENKYFTRDEFSNYLEDNGIETRTLFASIPTQYKAYEYLGVPYGTFPNSEYVGNNGIHIGCHQDITKEDCYYIVDTIAKFIRRF